ncbi:unnamed protein product [Diabrotica balteata]|uniref:Cytochrome c domain-containing protein n=1 Tax=Diabrotica balteata TaxID=107213 RepID=A0A9N9X9S3_DIABA|nr:unnamed protein product [Diabrotica balteata]
MPGDIERGKKLYMQRCAMCHTTEAGGKHKTGPNLHGFIGKVGGQISGFKFSKVNKEIGVWTEEKLDQLLENPKKLMPGSKMIFKGLQDAQARKDLIAYIKSIT